MTREKKLTILQNIVDFFEIWGRRISSYQESWGNARSEATSGGISCLTHLMIHLQRVAM